MESYICTCREDDVCNQEVLKGAHAQVCVASEIEVFFQRDCFYGHCTDGGYTILLIPFIFLLETCLALFANWV
jgi:hypothetical protein